MTISIVSASKQIEALLATKPGKSVNGIQPQDVKKIRRQIAVISNGKSPAEIGRSFPHWRVHHWDGSTATWSFDIGGSTRLLMEWNEDRKEVSDLRFWSH